MKKIINCQKTTKKTYFYRKSTQFQLIFIIILFLLTFQESSAAAKCVSELIRAGASSQSMKRKLDHDGVGTGGGPGATGDVGKSDVKKVKLTEQ